MRDTQEAVCLAARGVEAHDISLRIDPANLGTGCARIIDGRELSAAEQKSVNFLRRVFVRSDHVFLRIGVPGLRENAARHIERFEHAVPDDVAVRMAGGEVGVQPRDERAIRRWAVTHGRESVDNRPAAIREAREATHIGAVVQVVDAAVNLGPWA